MTGHESHPQRTDLNPGSLRDALGQPQGPFARVDIVASTGSTNSDLAAAANSSGAPSPSVLIADTQLAGLGRLGRAWETPAGSAMISSVFLRPDPARFDATGYAWLSILAGVALCTSIRSTASVAAELKWPNDVVANGKKLAGILAQLVQPNAGTAAGPGVVVGAGLNVSMTDAELPTDRATSLLVEGAKGAQLDRNVLLPAYLKEFLRLFAQFEHAGGNAQAPLAGGASLLELAAARMVTLGCEVRVELPGGALLLGTANGLAADGSLLVRDAAGTTHTVTAGDVIHVRRQGPGGTVHYA